MNGRTKKPKNLKIEIKAVNNHFVLTFFGIYVFTLIL